MGQSPGEPIGAVYFFILSFFKGFLGETYKFIFSIFVQLGKIISG